MKATDLFKVETLDTRFASATGQPRPDAQPAKWNTPEYYLYGLAFASIPILMFKAVYDVSRPEHPGYQHYDHLLDEGWIPGRKVDNSDSQYSGFRENIPYMALVLVLHPLLRRAYESLTAPKRIEGASGVKPHSGPVSSHSAEVRKESRVLFDIVFAALFLVALHGVSALKVFVILYLNYQIATALPRQYVGTTTWVFNIAILFANELCHGYKFADIAAAALPPTTTAAEKPLGDNWGAWIDSYGGLIPRWEILFNITVLRLISFNFDYLWMLDRRASSPIEVRSHVP